MALFVGKHVNKIDKKGRVSVPKPFRAALQGRGLSSLYVYPRFKQRALEACDEEFMARLSRSLDNLDLFSDDQIRRAMDCGWSSSGDSGTETDDEDRTQMRHESDFDCVMLTPVQCHGEIPWLAVFRVNDGKVECKSGSKIAIPSLLEFFRYPRR